MDDFWDGMLTRVAYQIAINEHSDINREFYSIDQAKEYLKAKSPTEYFDNVVIADLIREEKLELVASFAKEVSLAKIEGNPYFMDDYKLQKCITISCRNPLAAFKLIPLNPSGLEMIARVIVNQIIGNHLLSVSTRHDIFLFRQNEYWKVVDIDMCQLSGDVLYYPRCFLNDVTWGISAKSLERYCKVKVRVWDNLSEDEKLQTIESYMKAFGGNVSRISDELGISRVTTTKYKQRVETNQTSALVRLFHSIK